MEKLIMMDMSFDMIKVLKDTDEKFARNNLETFYVVGDEEFLPIKEKYAVLVLEWSSLLLNLQVHLVVEFILDFMSLCALIFMTSISCECFLSTVPWIWL